MSCVNVNNFERLTFDRMKLLILSFYVYFPLSFFGPETDYVWLIILFLLLKLATVFRNL